MSQLELPFWMCVFPNSAFVLIVIIQRENIESTSDGETPLTARPATCMFCNETVRQMHNMKHLISRTQRVNKDLQAENVLLLCEVSRCRRWCLAMAFKS